MNQLSWTTSQESAIPLKIDESHPMVQLTKTLPWEDIVAVAATRREKLGRNNTGPKTHFRALVGAVLVRSLKSVDFRETEDLVRNYLPARHMCDLHNSHWTPDHNTIFDFEQMMGPEGLHQLNVLFLHQAQDFGFLDPSSLCADTTAQEGKVPYPNEVGLMGSFAKSVKRSLKTLGKKAFKIKEKVVTKTKRVMQLVKEYRLFSKSKEDRIAKAGQMASILEGVQKDLGQYLSSINSSKVLGHQKVVKKNLENLLQTMSTLLPQIQHWIKTGWVAKNKIVSLFNPELRCIKRGKVGKDLEFGLKWGINQIKGGYVSLYENIEMMGHDSGYALEAIVHHLKIFGEVPKEFGFDRGGWSQDHLEEISKMGVQRVGVAPKGQSKWLVSGTCRKRLIRERAQVEGKIGTLKRYGMNRPEEKTTDGMRRAARRAELRFNLKKMQKDLFATFQDDIEIVMANT